MNKHVGILGNPKYVNSKMTIGLCLALLPLNLLVANNPADSELQNVNLSVNQQTKKVTGRVIGTNGDPLIGVNVVVKGTTIGTTTDMDGNYSLDGVAAGSELEFSYIGFLPYSAKVGNRAQINVTLSEDTQKLDEVVVVGYGSFKKSDLTGAISQVKGDEIASLPLRSASDALQGKVAGVTITANSGSPGSLGDVRIRGVGTLSAGGNNPLYVVDGMPQGDIGWLNARDIQNIEVLKDASAQAIYGSRAANGVVLVTTKRGTTGDSYRSNIEFDMNIGFQSASKRYDLLDAEGFMEYKNRAYAAAGKELTDDFATPERREAILSFLEKNGGREGTDWWDVINRKPKEAVNQTYNLALSGGMNKLNYRASFSYMNHKGILKGSDYERLSGRLNIDSEVQKWLKVSSNVNVIYQSRRNVQENDSFNATAFITAAADPITPVYRDNLVDVPDFLKDRIYNGYEPTNPWSRYTGVLYSNKQNAMAQVDRMAQNKWHGIATKANVTGDVKILPFLTFKSSISLDLRREQSDGFTPKYFLDGDEYSSYATVSRSVYNTDYWVFDNYLTYADTFDKHNISAMVGTSAEKDRYEYVGASKQGMVNNDKSQQIINAGTENPGASGYYSINTLNSYFGRVFYSYDNRYMVTANLRWDGSSKFADGNRWGFFPSVSGGWNFSEEHFLESCKSWLSQGKLRVGWGEIGNQTIPSGAYLSQYGNGSYYMFGDGNPNLYAYRSQVGNPNLKWETTRQLDLGLDLAFLEGSLRFTFDYYNRDTKDMLVQVPNPTSLGFPNTPWVNAGSISNKGFEVSIGYDGKAGEDFTYHINGNISTYKNKVKDLGSDGNIPGKGVHLGYYTYTMTEVDKPIGYYYGYKTDGVFQTQEEINNYQNNGQVVVAAQNLFTITGYSGLDPEIGELGGNPIYKGVDMGYYPQARSFMFGISMKL